MDVVTLRTPTVTVTGHIKITIKLKRIVVIGASSSSNSINRKFARYAANLISLKKEIIELDLREYEMSIYSEDLQQLL